ncbi:MAG: hypothetical protein AAF633_11860 [Chloroflexota bacterium]
MSVGHIAREVESAGIPTVIIATSAFRPRIEVMRVPRLVLTPYPMGRPLGAAGEAEGQRKTLEAALSLLGSATEGGTIVEVRHPFKTGRSRW